MLFLLITISIFYFSWIPDNKLASETYLPLWLLNWSNTYFNLRTAVPFVIFGFFLEALFSLKNKLQKNKNRFGFWFRNSAVVLVVVCLAEGGQFFISKRHPDIMDVMFGIIGSQIGFVAFYILKRFKANLVEKK
nr:VanZ family protein [Flavobacterium sp. 83]